jgi:hypothetical protein
MASLETGTPSRSFPLATSPLHTLAGGSQRTRGAPVNHESSNQKFANRHQLFYISKIRVKLLGKGYGIKFGAIINTLKTYGELEE